jgi:hypothetical protein
MCSNGSLNTPKLVKFNRPPHPLTLIYSCTKSAQSAEYENHSYSSEIVDLQKRQYSEVGNCLSEFNNRNQ